MQPGDEWAYRLRDEEASGPAVPHCRGIERAAPEPAFGQEEFARRIAMSADWVRHNMRSIQHVKIGARVRLTQEDVDAFLASRRVFPSLGISEAGTGIPTRRRRRRRP